MRDDWRTSLHTFERPITCSAPRSSETGGTPAASLPPPSSLNRPHTASAASPPEPAASEPARLEGGSAIVAVSGSGGVGRVAVIGLSRRLPPPALPRPPPPLTYGGEALPTYWDEAPLLSARSGTGHIVANERALPPPPHPPHPPGDTSSEPPLGPSDAPDRPEKEGALERLTEGGPCGPSRPDSTSAKASPRPPPLPRESGAWPS